MQLELSGGALDIVVVVTLMAALLCSLGGFSRESCRNGWFPTKKQQTFYVVQRCDADVTKMGMATIN